MSNRTTRLIIKMVQWGSLFATIVLVVSIITGNYNVSLAQDKSIICSDVDQVLFLTSKTGGYISPVDSVLIRVQYLDEMRKNGQLLSSDEFASRITSYYDTLVAVLAGLFIVFSLTTYFSFKQSFEIKFEDKRREIEDTQKEIKFQLPNDIRNELKTMLRESRPVREDIVSAVRGDVEEQFATFEALDELSSFVEKIERKQNDIIVEVAELQEYIASMTSIKKREGSAKPSKKANAQNSDKKEG